MEEGTLHMIFYLCCGVFGILMILCSFMCLWCESKLTPKSVSDSSDHERKIAICRKLSSSSKHGGRQKNLRRITVENTNELPDGGYRTPSSSKTSKSSSDSRFCDV